MNRKLLLLVALLLPIVANAFSGEVDIDGIKYDVSTKEQTANVIGPSSPDIAGEIVIPSSIVYEGKTCYVYSVGGFKSCNGITSVTLSEGITTVNSAAFTECENLIDINLPSTIKEVGSNAFYETAWFVKQDDGVVYLDNMALNYKGEMAQDTELSLKEGTTLIANSCFRSQENLMKIHFPESLKSIGEWAFLKCTSLSSISLQNLDVHWEAFALCERLKEVTLINVNFVPRISKQNIYTTKYYYDVFRSCDSIETVTINCKVIGDWFKGKPSITSLTLGDDVEVINDDAFSGCTGLKNVELPPNITYLSGFGNCTGLKAISIPSKVKTIGNSAFSGCTGLTSLAIPSNVERIGFSAFRSCQNILSLELSEGLRVIEGHSFVECTSLASLAIPNGVDSIGSEYENDGAFSGCTALKTVSLPRTIKHLGRSTFSNCKALIELILPEGLTTINTELCSGDTKLAKVVIPSTVNTIYGWPFESCKDLEDVYCYSPVVPIVSSYMNPFEGSEIQNATLHVPAQSIDSYKEAKYWQDFKEIVAIPDYDAKKCAAPQIIYKNGKLSFACDTEGAEFVSEITDSDIKKSNLNEIELTATYNIYVYATAPDHAKSDTIRATLCWIDAEPKTEGITDGVAKVRANPVLIQSNGNVLNISGADVGTPISVYDMAGKLVGSANSTSESTSVTTSLSKGQVCIIKIGEKSVKVIMK